VTPAEEYSLGLKTASSSSVVGSFVRDTELTAKAFSTSRLILIYWHCKYCLVCANLGYVIRAPWLASKNQGLKNVTDLKSFKTRFWNPCAPGEGCMQMTKFRRAVSRYLRDQPNYYGQEGNRDRSIQSFGQFSVPDEEAVFRPDK